MSKTPVSILQELCARNTTVPQYDLVVNGVGSHDPIFKYKLTVCEVVTYGSGKSKKEAKHEAARAALTILQESSTIFNSFKTNKPEILEQVEDITSPYHGVLKENAVGDLNLVCGNNKLPEPSYELIGEEGPPHAKQFTFECRVAKIVVEAASRTKKQAKHLSAKKMLERLVEMLGDKLVLTTPEQSEDPSDDQLDEKAKTLYANLKSTKLNENFDLLIKDYHKVDMSTVFGDNPKAIIELKNYNSDGYPSSEALTLLEKLFKDVEAMYVFKEMPSKVKHIRIFTCELDTTPAFVVFGMDKNEEAAKCEAADKMLKLLKEFCN